MDQHADVEAGVADGGGHVGAVVGQDAVQVRLGDHQGVDLPGDGQRVDGVVDHVDAVVPLWRGVAQPLLGLYRKRCRGNAAKLLSAGKASLHALLEDIQAATVSEQDVRAEDPDLLSFININVPEDLYLYVGQ